MKNYHKPSVVLSSELAEGVYMASGDTGSYSVSNGGVGTGYKDYLLSITNNSDAHVDSVTLTLTVYGNVTDVRGVKSSITAQIVNPTTVVVTYANSGYGIKGGETVKSIPVRVFGTGDYGILF